MKTIDSVLCSTRVHGIVPDVPQLEFELVQKLRDARLETFTQADSCIRTFLDAKFPQLYHNWWAAEPGMQIDVEDVDSFTASSAIVIVIDADPLITVRVH